MKNPIYIIAGGANEDILKQYIPQDVHFWQFILFYTGKLKNVS